ncbi:MAG: glutaredoxin domain-containing protein [Dehalococcoidia bacterium]
MATIKVYGAPWCPDCRRTKTFLGDQRVAYDWIDIDIDRDPEGMRFVEELQDGGRTIPTVVFEDGSHLLEPSNEEVARKLGLRLEAERSSYDLVIVGGGPAGLSAAIYAAREGIETSETFESSMPGVFAAGDVRAGSTKQVGAAVGEGIAALLMVRNFLRAHSHLSPTSVNA